MTTTTTPLAQDGHATPGHVIHAVVPAPEVDTRVPSATRPVNPALSDLLRKLTPGQKIKVTQTVRIGRKEWITAIEGTFRSWNHLNTGLSTDRVAVDDIVVPAVHFTKLSGELTSVTLDEHSKIELIG